MHVRLQSDLQGTRDGEEGKRLLGSCVHCGFCLAACPTYRLLGDELDSPRGRLYLVKGLLEGAPQAFRGGNSRGDETKRNNVHARPPCL